MTKTEENTAQKLLGFLSGNKARLLGVGLLVISLLLFLLAFRGPILEELRFLLNDTDNDTPVVLPRNLDVSDEDDEGSTADFSEGIIPVDTEFGIIIPKLGANSSVIANVDPFDGRIYQQELSRGVAHAEGTKLPGEQGNMFLFAHSSTDFEVANQYNSIFYLIYKLDPGDYIYITYQDEIHRYVVREQKTVDPSETKYLTEQTSQEELRLMTCWPPGTPWQRLIVFAERDS